MEMFYQVVRYRTGPQHFVDRVHDIIMANVSLIDVWSYEMDIRRLYRDIENYFNLQQSQSSGANQQDIQQSSGSNEFQSNADQSVMTGSSKEDTSQNTTDNCQSANRDGDGKENSENI